MIVVIKKEIVKFRCPTCKKIQDIDEDIIFSTCECGAKITQKDRLNDTNCTKDAVGEE